MPTRPRDRLPLLRRPAAHLAPRGPVARGVEAARSPRPAALEAARGLAPRGVRWAHQKSGTIIYHHGSY